MPNKRFPLTGIASGLATRPPRKATRINQSTAQTPNRNMKLRKHHNQTINSIQSNHHYVTCINLVHISPKKRTNVPWTRHEHTIQSHSIESERHFHKKSHELPLNITTNITTNITKLQSNPINPINPIEIPQSHGKSPDFCRQDVPGPGGHSRRDSAPHGLPVAHWARLRWGEEHVDWWHWNWINVKYRNV